MDAPQIEKAMRNVLQLLQTEPAAYKRFGIYWYPVKALLRRYYTQDNLYLLGNYEDADGASRVPKLPLAELLAAAFEEYSQNTALADGQPGKVFDAEGEPYSIYDEDAGL